MNIFTTSLELRGKHEDVIFVNADTISDIQDNDIVLTTGTMNDEMYLDMILSKATVPFSFMIKTPKDKFMNDFVSDVSLTIYRKDHTLDDAFLDECKELAKSIQQFQSLSDEIAEMEEDEVRRRNAAELYFLSTVYNYMSESFGYGFRGSAEDIKQEPSMQISIDAENTQSSAKTFYVKLGKDEQYAKIFRVEKKQEKNSDVDTFKDELAVFVNDEFETIYKSEYNLLAKEYDEYKIKKIEDITLQYEESYILFDENLIPLDLQTNAEGELELDRSVTKTKVYRLKSAKNIAPHNLEKYKEALKALQKIFADFDKSRNKSIEDIQQLLMFITLNKRAKNLWNNLSKQEIDLLKKQYRRDSTFTKKEREVISKNIEKIVSVISKTAGILKKRYINVNKENPIMINFAISIIQHKSIDELSANIINTVYKDIDVSINISRIAKDHYNKKITSRQFDKYIEYIENAEKLLQEYDLAFQPIDEKPFQRVKNKDYIYKLIFLLKERGLSDAEKTIEKLKNIIDWINDEQEIFTNEDDKIFDNFAKENSPQTKDLERIDNSLILYCAYYAIKNNKISLPKNYHKILKMFLYIFGELTIPKERFLCFYFFIDKIDEFDKIETYRIILFFDDFVSKVLNTINESKITALDEFLQSNNINYKCRTTDHAILLYIDDDNKPYTYDINKLLNKKSKYKNNSAPKKFHNFMLDIVYSDDDIDISGVCMDQEKREIVMNFFTIYGKHKKSIDCKEYLEEFWTNFKKKCKEKKKEDEE